LEFEAPEARTVLYVLVVPVQEVYTRTSALQIVANEFVTLDPRQAIAVLPLFGDYSSFFGTFSNALIFTIHLSLPQLILFFANRKN
jgi:hypothetical protein